MRPFKYLFWVSCVLIAVSCRKEQVTVPSPPKEMTVLVYMAANNDLQNDALNCINKMELAAKNIKGNLIVFIKTNASGSCLLKIKYDKTDKIVSDTIRKYGVANSSDPVFLRKVIHDSRQLYPAKSYGLIVWSHATSWAPVGGRKQVTKAIGMDDGQEMDIKDFKEALPGDFTYILFDACLMGSAEAVYELKDKAKYILASPSEVLSDSYPYDIITPYLFGDKEELILVAKYFVDSYRRLTGDYASATASLIDCSELDSLAFKTKQLLDKRTAKDDLNRYLVQRMDFDFKSPVTCYDLLNFLQNNYDQEDILDIEKQLSRTVIFKDHTDSFLGTPIRKYSGLSIYLPVKSDPREEYYSTLMWYNSGGFYNLFH